MKSIKLLALLFLITACCFAQPVPYPNFSSGSGTPNVGLCNGPVNISNVYIQTQDPANGFSGVYFCLQTGGATLGSGAYTWKAMATQPGTPTTGTVSVANGKAAVISNSLTFAGTDGTTLTFPTTSATIARTDAANTFTGTQTVGALVATTVNGNTFTAGTGVLTIAAAKTLTANNTLTLAGTDGTTTTLPATTAGVPAALFCGATSGSTTCANTSGGGTARVFGGIATLASNTAVISGISPAFTSTSTFACVANDLTTRANPVAIANTSSSSITITNTTGSSDVINYLCSGY